MDGQMHQYEAIGVEGDKIVFLGADEEGLAQQWDERTDLKGALMLPGFMDTHMHMLYYGQMRQNVDLFGLPSIDAVVERCRAHMAARNPNALIGWGWNQEHMAEKRYLTKEDVDRVSQDIPVILLRTCGHIAACNTRMLEALKKLEGLNSELLGLIDFQRGILREEAMMLYTKVMPPISEADVRNIILEAQRDLNAAGLTCVHSHDLRVIAGLDDFDLIRILRSMSGNGELTVRIYEQCMVDQVDFPRLAAARDSYEDHKSLFRTGPRKVVGDGSLGAKSAAVIDGYVDEPDNHGIPLYTDQEMYESVKAAHDIHMNVAVHAIGDHTFRQVCDAVERVQRENPWPGHRHGIIHAQITSPDLLLRAKELGLQTYIQPIFIDADMELIDQRVGEAHAKDCYNWKSMLDLGLHVSGGSDCPVEPVHVLDNIRSAVTRKNRAGDRTYLPEQALTVEQAVRLFTSAAAWASYDEDWRGTLEPGKLADMVVLDMDLFTADPDGFAKGSVVETVLNGRTVYRGEA